MHEVVLARHEATEPAAVAERAIGRDGLGQEVAELGLLLGVRERDPLVAVDLDPGAAGAGSQVGRRVARAEREDVDVRVPDQSLGVDQEEELAAYEVDVVEHELGVLDEPLPRAGAVEAEAPPRDIALLLRPDRLHVEAPMRPVALKPKLPPGIPTVR